MTEPTETVDLVGVRANGEHVNLGKVTMPPRMKAREIARSYFGHFDDEDGSDAELCFGALETLLDWLSKQGWEPNLKPIQGVHPAVSKTLVNQLLEALETSRVLKSDYDSLENYGVASRKHAKAIADARAYVSTQPVQAMERIAKSDTPQELAGEPVAWLHTDKHGGLQAFTSEPPPSLKAQCKPLYTTPQPTQAQAVAVPLTDGRILEVVGLAPDRKVCASTCMTVKFDKKPCQCYPTSASRSEVVAIARAVESAHGITKGGRHGPA